jgi:hypothetical protein
MVPATDENASAGEHPLNLSVAAEAEVGIRRGEHFGVDRAVRVMAGGATLAQGGVLINKRFGLFPMALGTGLIQSRPGQAGRRFHDVQAMRIMALNAIHLALEDGMVLGKMKLNLRLQMTPDAGLGIAARVDDEFFQAALPSRSDVFAPWAVAGFASVLASHLAVIHMEPGMGAAGKNARNFVVAIRAGLVADEGCAFDL